MHKSVNNNQNLKRNNNYGTKMKSPLHNILLAYASIIVFTQHIFICSFEMRSPNAVDKNKLNSPTKRKIVGGEETAPGRYPYQVGLLDNNFNFCGGTLVAPEWVLTAAHCLYVKKKLKVDIGRHNRSNGNETYEIIDVEFVVIHPDYNHKTLQNDFALIKLENPSSYLTITLNNDKTYPADDANVTVMGWGRIKEYSISSDILLEVEVDVVNETECAIAYEMQILSNDMICASRPNKDACQGDSGGPLIVKGENATMDIQVGIVSWGIGCANPKYPGVYSRISAGYNFIQTTMSCLIPDGNAFNEYSKITCREGVFCDNCNFPFDGFNYVNCSVEYPEFLSNGYCDTNAYNTPECNYDGGDCCEDTCVSGPFTCGVNDYNCKTAEIGSFPQDGFDYSYCDVLDPNFIGNGECNNFFYNTPQCNYDGGDCCEDTCIDGKFPCETNSQKCKDPESNFYVIPNFPQDSFDYSNCNVTIPKAISDGYCDKGLYNTPQCNYDGGDCCEDTCVDGVFVVCGECNSLCDESCYECKDPESTSSRENSSFFIEKALDMITSIKNSWS